MKIYKFLPILLFFITLALNGYSQSTPDSILNTFFNKYEGNKKAALDYIFSTNLYIPREKTVELYKDILGLKKIIGEYTGYEFLVKKNAGESLVLYSYLIKYAHQPVRFTISFYKPKDKWILYNFKYDSKVEEELQSAASLGTH